MRSRVCAETLILSAICLTDMLLTLYFVLAGLAVEQNPIMAACINRSPVVFVLVKLLSFAPFVVAVELYRRKNPSFARTVCRWAIVAYLTVFTVLTAAANLPI